MEAAPGETPLHVGFSPFLHPPLPGVGGFGLGGGPGGAGGAGAGKGVGGSVLDTLMSAHEFHTWAVSSQSQRHCSTYSPS